MAITSDEPRNTLLVVTTLIVAVTFQAALNPPGGVWQEDRYDPEENCTVDPRSGANNRTVMARAGTSVLHSRAKIRYDTFIFVNTLAFSAATSTILFSLLASGTSFRTETLISIYCMNFAYGASVGAVQPQTPKTWAIILGALFAPYIFRQFANIKSSCCK